MPSRFRPALTGAVPHVARPRERVAILDTMADPLLEEFDAALALIRAAIDGEKVLSRYHARALLLPLGALMTRADRTSVARDAAARARELVERDREGWDTAVHDELEMAVAEHVRSADPQFARRPDYDVVYARTARERLQARLDATTALGGEPAREQLERIALADRILAPHLGRR